jgi:hypothetical protein
MWFLLHDQIGEVSVRVIIIQWAQYWQERAVTQIVQETRGMRLVAHRRWNPSVRWAVEALPLETLGAHRATGKLTVARAGGGPWTRGPRTGEWLWVYTLMIFGDYKYIVILGGMNIVSCSKCIFFKTWMCPPISPFCVNKRSVTDCCVTCCTHHSILCSQSILCS